MKDCAQTAISCPRCGFSFHRGEVVKECSNCFACSGCEIYICPECEEEIIVKPMREPWKEAEDISQDSQHIH